MNVIERDGNPNLQVPHELTKLRKSFQLSLSFPVSLTSILLVDYALLFRDEKSAAGLLSHFSIVLL